MNTLMSFVNTVVGGPSDPVQTQAKSTIILPWEDYKEKAKTLRIKGSLTDILRDRIFDISLDDSNFLIFSKEKDTDLYEFSFEEKVPVIMAIMEQDQTLAKTFSRLVPRHTSEELFWKSYFYTVEVVRDQLLQKFSTKKPSQSEESGKEQEDKHRELMDELESELSAEPKIVKRERSRGKEPIIVTELQQQLKTALTRIEELEKRVSALEMTQKLGTEPAVREETDDQKPSFQ